jgi:cell division protein FtsN
MEKKQRFFIYDRKEVGVLLLLGVMVAVFAFTLGVHLGKRVTGKASPSGHGVPTETSSPVTEAPSLAETEQAMTQPTAVPPAMVEASEEAINHATHDEVSRTGVKLEDSRQLELPEKTKSNNAGATSPAHGVHAEHAPKPAPQAHATNNAHEAEHASSAETHLREEAHQEERAESEAPSAELENPQQREAMAELKALAEKAKGHHSRHKSTAKSSSKKKAGIFTLQVGSYSSRKEAEDRVKDLEISGVSPRIQAIDIPSKGRWYRIYLGGFPTKSAAEKAGQKYRAQGMIDSFIVAKSVE